MLASSSAVTDAVLALSALILVLALIIIAYVTARRRWRARDFRQIDLFRSLLPGTIKAAAGPALDYEAAVAKLSELLSKRLSTAMALALVECTCIPGETDAVLRIARDLGFVESWRRGLGAALIGADEPLLAPRLRWRLPGYATRARSADYLGRVRHSPSWRLLVRALDDPHPDVREAALRSLADIAEPESVPLIVRKMQAAAGARTRRIPDRPLLAAWGHFPAHFASALLPLLQGTDARLRRLGADCLVQMLQPGAQPSGNADLACAGQEVRRVVLTRLAQDEDPEVRARAAVLLGSAGGTGAEQKLRQLAADRAWFVRLHAVRALGTRKHSDSMRLLAGRLCDTNWRVREAAARALGQWGDEGLHQLAETFLSTKDRYTREQIAEELEASGGIAEVLEQYAGTKSDMGVKAPNEVAS